MYLIHLVIPEPRACLVLTKGVFDELSVASENFLCYVRHSGEKSVSMVPPGISLV